MAGPVAANPGFVFDGYRRFWRVTDLLLQDLEPSAEEWHGLLGSAGYRDLVAHEFPRDFFPDSFRLAFKPSHGSRLAQALLSGPRAEVLRHYLLAEETRAHIARGLEALASAPVASAARRAALQWLPEGVAPEFPTVAFVIFGPDARGYSNVVVDAAFLCQLVSPVGLLAHEYHHVFRRQMTKPRGARRTGDEDVLWVLDQLEAEGIADQIDKRHWPNELPAEAGRMADYARRYRHHFRTAPDLLRRLDARLSAWRASPQQRPAIARQLRASLPLAGHPTGSFMARQIEAAFGHEACVRTVGDPFAFMRRYSEAAAGSVVAPPLSDAALKAVAMLEHAYLQPS